MKITAFNVCKRSIISFVIFCSLVFSALFYLMQPIDASANIDLSGHSDTPLSANLSLTEKQAALYISNADNPVFINTKYTYSPAACTGLVSDATAGAAFIFETSVLKAFGADGIQNAMNTGKVVLNETNKK